MARFYDGPETYYQKLDEPNSATVVYCKIFRDVVTDAVCVLRRQNLAMKSAFSCSGCIMNTALDQRSC